MRPSQFPCSSELGLSRVRSARDVHEWSRTPPRSVELVWIARMKRTRNMGIVCAMMLTAGSRKLKMDMKTMKSRVGWLARGCCGEI